MAVVAVLFARRVAYFLYDFHFFFPKVAARWQTGALALVGLSLPMVFRMGIAPVLLALNSSAIYLGQAIGAAGGGWLIAHRGFGWLSWAGLTWLIAALALSAWAGRRNRRAG